MSHSKDSVYRLPPQCYLHVLDTNSNITRLEVGPQTFVRKDHECVVVNPTSMINIPPQHYCEILNPVVRDAEQKVIFDNVGSTKLKFGDSEIRLHQEPFPFYPGEIMKINVTPLKIVQSNTALKLKAIINIDEEGIKKISGDEWLFEGPGVYIPVKGVQVVEEVQACVVLINHALRLKATKEFVDRRGINRVTGEEWLIKKIGSYIPDVFEQVIKYVSGYVLTEKKALHLKALKTFTDDYNINRKSGEEWLITMHDTEIHIPGVYEEIVGEIDITTLTNRQYCVILDPVDEKGKPQLGKKKLIKGDKSFFLMPGESLELGIQNVYVLGENEGLILKAIEEFQDTTVKRLPGDRWLIRGPTEVIPSIEVEVICKRVAIALDKNEGIYVRDINTGLVRSVTGHTYMLTENEELWEKILPDTVEDLLGSCVDPLADRSERNERPKRDKKRDKTKVVTYRVPHNAAVQIYDYKEKTARIHYGPDLVMLGPDEHFTQLSLSGGKPKKPNQIKSLCLLLGPDFCTDIIVVETSDHARLSLQVSYNWHFKTEAEKTQNTGTKLFSVPDFVGDACKALASRIRGTVAAVRFDDFHKNSARIIRSSVFGIDANNKVREEFIFPQNNLCITSIDIQSVEPVDQRTRESLQKSVQLAIEITTKSQEASARHEADRIEQQAKGRLERQMITDQAEAEKTKTELLQLKAASAAVESTGQAKAEAQSRAEASKIEGEANVDQARLKAEANTIEAESELARVIAARKAEIEYCQKNNEVSEIHAQKMADIEIYKFSKMVEAIGQNTLIEIAKAGPDSDVRLLKSIGLKSALITDGSTPINLFQTAQGLIKKSICAGMNVTMGDNESN